MEQPSILGGARRLATSSSALLAIGAIASIVVMAMYGRIEGQAAVDFVTWVVLGYFGKVAVEDGAKKLGEGKSHAAEPVVTSAKEEKES